MFREKYSKLVGKIEAIKEKFVSELKSSVLKLVSVAGHGKSNCVCGYTQSGKSPFTHILLTNDVTKELAAGKIFHMLSCSTAKDLGPTLVSNGAIAYVGYDEVFKFSHELETLKPDCTIDQELIKGKTVNQAVENAKAEYKLLMNKLEYGMSLKGILKHSCDALVVKGNGKAKLLQDNNDYDLAVIGNGNAKLLQDNNRDEQQKSSYKAR